MPPSMFIILFLILVLVFLFAGRLAEILHERVRDRKAVPVPVIARLRRYLPLSGRKEF